LRAPVDLAFSWLADLGEHDHNGPRFSAGRRSGTVSYREVLSITRESAIVKDVMRAETTYQRARFFPGDRIEYECSETPDHFRPWSVWRFEPSNDGVGCVIKVEFSPGMDPTLARSAYPRVKADAERHVSEMEAEVVARASRPAGPDVKVWRK
jgi:hypothetical protein